MKRRYPELVGDIIQKAIAESGNTQTFQSQHIVYLWPEVVGPTINRFTTSRWMVRDELHVVIASASLKTELAFMSPHIIDELNRLAGTDILRRLVIH